MGGGAVNLVDIPMIQFKATSSSSSSSSSPPPPPPPPLIPRHPSSPSSFSSSSSSSNLNFPLSVNNSTAPLRHQFCTACCCNCATVTSTRLYESKQQDRRPTVGPSSSSSNNVIFGPVPSQFEVESALSALQNFMQQGTSSSCGSEFNWLLQMLESSDVRALVSRGFQGVYGAFRLLHTEPSIKKLVVSLASDKAIWAAVINNEMVRKIREPDNTAAHRRLEVEGCDHQEPDVLTHILRWIVEISKAKVNELIQKFHSLVNGVFQTVEGQGPGDKTRDEVDDKVRSSLLLTIVILFIVAVARLHRA